MTSSFDWKMSALDKWESSRTPSFASPWGDKVERLLSGAGMWWCREVDCFTWYFGSNGSVLLFDSSVQRRVLPEG
jgi:hypothetical protein